MKNYEIFINGISTGRGVVNSPSLESALDVHKQFNGVVEGLELKEVAGMTVPGMFSNCIMDLPKEFTTKTKLTGFNVNQIFKDCLFDNGEETMMPFHKSGHGVMLHAGFHPKRLESNRHHIENMLDQLPNEFKEGMSFLNACVSKDDDHWGEHHSVDQLLCLGLALDKLEYCFPRDAWSALPGGMPYFKIK